jgi:hypothetical protein
MRRRRRARPHAQSFAVELQTQLLAARQQAASGREVLIRTLGLSGSDLRFRLPEALPALPQQIRGLPAVEAEAIRRRLDLQIARDGRPRYRTATQKG